ncbi:MAG: hypothetical protein Q8P70_00170 [bacterium]|nr:hypothetical protein [bacterium]
MQTHHIHISLSSQASERELQDALTLLVALKLQGKHVTMEDTVTTRKILPSYILLPTPTPPSGKQEKVFLVSLKGLAPWISKIRYEKTRDDLQLYFSVRSSKTAEHTRQEEPTIEALPLAFSSLAQGEKDVTLMNPSEISRVLNYFSQEDQISCRVAGHALSTMRRGAQHLLLVGMVPREVFISYGAKGRIMREVSNNIQKALSSSPFCVLFESPTAQTPQLLGWKMPQDILKNLPLEQTKGNWTLCQLPTSTLQEAFETLFTPLND